MTDLKIKEFHEEFKLRTGLELELRLPDLDDPSNKVKRFANRCEMIVMQEIKSKYPNYREEDLLDLHRKAIWDAILEQAIYMINVGDMSLISGYDPVSGNMTPINEIRKRMFSPNAKLILLNAGLLYSGIGKRSYSPYLEERSGWR